MTEIPGEFPLPEEAAQRQRSLLGAHIEAGRRSARTTRRGLVAVAVVILVGGLLVTPALGIGSRLLDLIESPPALPGVRSPVWSPGGGRIAFLSRGERSKEVYVVNADGSGQRRLTGDARFPAAPAWSPNGRQIAFEGGSGDPEQRLCRERRRERSAQAGAQRARSCLVSRRANDRVLQRLQDLPHERRRERAPATDEDTLGRGGALLRGRPTGGSSPSSTREAPARGASTSMS